MDFLSGLAKSAQSKPAADEPEKHSNTDEPTKHSNTDEPKKHSNTDLFANAKVVAEAAQAQFGNEPEKCDKGKAATAAAELLDAAEAYAKLDGSKGVGKYAEQAEDYLRKYDAGDHKTAVTEATAPTTAAPEATVPTTAAPEHGDYKKPSDDAAKKSEGGGSGDLLKAAGSFFK